VRFLARRAAGYDDANMHAEVVNGMDVLAVWDAVTRGAETARRGDGAVVLECMTYRYMGHSLSDSRVRYRSRKEEESWKACDALCQMGKQLVEAEVLSDDEVAALEEKAQARIRRATDWAAHAADPDPKDMYDGLLTDTTSEGIGDEYRTTQIHKRVRRFKRDSDGCILYRHAVWEALCEEMMRDRRVILYGEDVADYGGAFQVTVGLIDAFGRDRVFNAAISEAAICGTAAGAAMVGMRPVVELMYIDFLPLALDQIGNQIAKTRYMFGGKATLPLVVRTTLGGGKGYAGQHSQSLEAVVTQFPGLKVVAPSTAYDVKGLLKSSIRDDNPVIFLEHQLLYTEKGPVPEEEHLVPLGVANVLREGSDLTLVAYSRMAQVALDAAEQAAEEGIGIEVVDPRTLIPLDLDTIAKSVAKTGRLMLACQAPHTGCFAEHIAYEAQACCFQHLKVPAKIVAAYDVPPPMAQPLEQENIPDAAKLLREAKAML
jgi:2-oxoisovalerate dehydrogenase E1 component